MKPTLRHLLACGAFVAAGFACVANASAAEVVIVNPTAPPPVERVEVVPGPRAGYVWDKGHWRWEHGRYVWAQGHWQRERVGMHWVPGHWDDHHDHWVWVDGHWA
ncbi:YXWGXW repeat-containing protein [Pararobbsia silviterrae]|uniref:BcpO-related WXXGXW repeat protein n=1 Tax=Pararobbsia silviterrae TaxID=1792498 RepID=A0A494Y1C1_9BURK|nr:YXWGXW repeat-containing protein [Pararobbsia silviterrae]RKP56039.1 hypothetical protein D7S86_11620 [Pararobbsia silviterrae]